MSIGIVCGGVNSLLAAMKVNTVILAGGTSGIGLATAKILLECGHKVIIGGRRVFPPANDQRLLKSIEEKNLRVIDLDVTEQSSVNHFFASIEAAFSKVDVLIYFSGVMKLSLIQELKINEWEEMFNTNVLGLLRCTAGCLPLFKKSGYGKMINVGSVAGHKVATPDGTVYSATKFAVAALSEGMRQELAELNISVTLVSPGATKTELGQNSSNRESRDRIRNYYASYGMEVGDVAKQIAEIAVSNSTANVSEIVLRSLHHRF
jgi:NADP-dependent 3-hydroxy acid dehydrogenase YdfG